MIFLNPPIFYNTPHASILRRTSLTFSSQATLVNLSSPATSVLSKLYGPLPHLPLYNWGLLQNRGHTMCDHSACPCDIGWQDPCFMYFFSKNTGTQQLPDRNAVARVVCCGCTGRFEELFPIIARLCSRLFRLFLGNPSTE